MHQYLFLWIALFGLSLIIIFYHFWICMDSFDTYSYQMVDSPYIKKTVKHDELVNARRDSSVSLDLEKAMLTDQIILDEIQANYQGV
jgi:hypothetical protein